MLPSIRVMVRFPKNTPNSQTGGVTNKALFNAIAGNNIDDLVKNHANEVPVEDTSAWRTGLRVWAAAATIGAEPSPDSLEKSPRAIP